MRNLHKKIAHHLRLKTFNPESSKAKRILLGIGLSIVALIGLGIISLLGLIIVLSISLPDIREIEDFSFQQSTLILDREGNLLYSVHGEENREIIPIDQMPQHFINATLAIEDDQFYEHPGFDLGGLTKAFLYECCHIGVPRGGSTITQQFVKNAFLTPERSYVRKLKELILSIKLESTYSKDEILELYLNKIPYGNNAYGVELAAQTYFSKPARELDLAESAILASLPKAPSRYSPYGQHRYSIFLKEFTPEEIISRNLESEADLEIEEFSRGLIGKLYKLDEGHSVYLRGRADLVLRRMEELEMISPTEKDAAWDKTQTIEFKPARQNIKAPHFVFYVKELLEEKYGKDVVEQGGLKVYTTLDPHLQETAETLVTKYATEKLATFEATNASLVSLHPQTGQILAMVGSVDYFNDEIDGQVNVARRPRQPGSSFKPIVYAQAFLNGYAPGTILYDIETSFGGGDPPQNYDGRFMGPMTIRRALGLSRNIPAIKAYYLAGEKDPIIALAEKMGIEALSKTIEYGWPLGIGTGEVPLLEMVEAYSVFANSGWKREPTPFLKILDSKGTVLEKWEENVTKEEVLDPQVAFLINHILSDQANSVGVRLSLPGQFAAAKTGTSNKKLGENKILPNNAWTIGYTTKVVTGVWTGNADGTAMRWDAAGYTLASPIWHDYMVEATKDIEPEEFPKPSGIKYVAVSRINGLLPGEKTPEEYIVSDYFSSYSVPTKYDNAFEEIQVDTETALGATPYCPEENLKLVNTIKYHSLDPSKYPSWEEGIRTWIANGIDAFKSADYGEDEWKLFAPVDPYPHSKCDLHNAESAAKAPTIRVTKPLPFDAVGTGRIPIEVEFNALNGADRVEYWRGSMKQYNATKTPFTGYLRIASNTAPGTKIPITIKGYDQSGYVAKTIFNLYVGEIPEDATILYIKEDGSDSGDTSDLGDSIDSGTDPTEKPSADDETSSPLDTSDETVEDTTTEDSAAPENPAETNPDSEPLILEIDWDKLEAE